MFRAADAERAKHEQRRQEIERRLNEKLCVWVPLMLQKRINNGRPLHTSRRLDAIFYPPLRCLLLPSMDKVYVLSYWLKNYEHHLVEVPGKGWRAEPMPKV